MLIPLLLMSLSASPEAGLEHALAGRAKQAAAELSSDPAARGLALLIAGRPSAARPLLMKQPKLAVYLAMAQVEGAGGIGRARETLAKAEPSPGIDFLLALAFAQTGDAKKADQHLARAVTKSESVLDEAFAPDPAVALARHLLPKATDKARIARALLQAGRRAEAIRIAEKIDAGDVLAEAWAPIDPRRALRHAKSPGAKARLHWRLGEKEKARALLDEAGDESVDVLRLRVLVLLDAGEAERAVEVAQEAARLDPKSDHAPYLVARALLAAGQSDRAHAFAKELLRRKPMEVDPFGVLAEIQKARRRTQEVRALELRSQAHQNEREKLNKARRRREAVIAAVRDAESGLGQTGLEAVRGADPTFSLVVDLALAKLGRRGTAAAARDRILAACGDDLRKFLAHRGPWEQAEIDVSPYGRVRKTSTPLSAADPGRCGGRVLRK